MKSILRRVSRIAALVAICACGLVSTSCEEGENYETVFLYVINGYAGSNSMRVIGPTGIIADNVRFGDRVARDGVCPVGERCYPIAFDRSLGTNLTLIVDGTPAVVELEAELFSMYPHETGTVVITDRTATDSFNFHVLRHVQTVSRRCALTLVNGLSLTNEHTLDTFTMTPEFQMVPEAAGYLDESTLPFQTSCGPLPTDAPQHDQLARTELYEQVSANNWFLPVECEDSDLDGLFCFAWGVPNPSDGRSVIYDKGQARTMLATQSYYDCVQQAIKVKQPEQDPMSMLPPAQESCPAAPLTWADVEIDYAQVQSCLEPDVSETISIEPGTSGGVSRWTYIEGVTSDLAPSCSHTFRPRGRGLDTIFGPISGSDEKGFHQNGDPIVNKVDIHVGSEHFWIMLGRPVNPIIWQWDSGEAFADVNDYPYLNGKDGEIGESTYPR